MYIFNYSYLKQSINTDDLKLNTYDTIINYDTFLQEPRGKIFLKLCFSSFGFLPFYDMLETITQKFYCFV